MSSKRSAPPTPGSREKKRKVLSLAEKMDVLAVIDSGLGWSATGKKFGLHEATVRTIWKTREKIRQSVRESADVSSKVASVSRRDPLLEKMEKILNRWISEQVDQRKSNVDGVAIREKARSIYDHLAEKEPSGSSPAPGFIASHGVHPSGTHTPKVRQFLLLCTGQRGPCYNGTKLFEVVRGPPGECVWGGDYERNNGRGGAALEPYLDVHVPCLYRESRMAGDVLGWGGDLTKGAQFFIITKDKLEVSGLYVIGKVEGGLEVVAEAARHYPITEVTVVDCGVVVD
ncbi:NK-tumor recognition protein [Chionoecetes opilio]|uniref:NK-tumor recognition protein n=1 Tax=Chionoecetes opilio TaxID=41210 RepID=A0A8J4XPF2_CHIOP|nr:NK-tumor recognition protein [Chionoecetes opilio]